MRTAIRKAPNASQEKPDPSVALIAPWLKREPLNCLPSPCRMINRFVIQLREEEKMDFPAWVTDSKNVHLHFHEQDSNFKFSQNAFCLMSNAKDIAVSINILIS